MIFQEKIILKPDKFGFPGSGFQVWISGLVSGLFEIPFIYVPALKRKLESKKLKQVHELNTEDLGIWPLGALARDYGKTGKDEKNILNVLLLVALCIFIDLIYKLKL